MPNILIVDDSPIDRVLVEGVLKKDPRVKTRQAQSGTDALAILGQWQPDVVVTDLQMPEMDGLALVTAIRIHYPAVRVILITAYGSEELAVRALEQGAASYVPKSQLAHQLLAVVDQVVELAREDRGYQALTQAMEYAEFRFRAPSNFEVTERLVELVQQMVAGIGVCDTGGQVRLGMALEEALRTAILRGNLELTPELLLAISTDHDRAHQKLDARRAQAPYAGRRLAVHVKCTPDEATFVISHEGPPLDLPKPGQSSSPDLEDPADRSLILMQAFMEEVTFSPDGKSITLVKRRSPAK